MIVLLDEQMSETAALTLNTMVAPIGHEIEHIVAIGGRGMGDEDIPGLCADLGVDALVSVNVKDFGARKVYYAALLDQGVHIAVVRPGKIRFDVGQQVGLLAPKIGSMIRSWEKATSPTLLRVTASGVTERSLADLLAEIDGSNA